MPAEGRGLSSEPTPKVGKGRRLGNLATPTSVQRLQTALHAKAKEEPEFRFHAPLRRSYSSPKATTATMASTANMSHCGLAAAFDSRRITVSAKCARWSPRHPFFVATLFQPERAAPRGEAPPLVASFVGALQ